MVETNYQVDDLYDPFYVEEEKVEFVAELKNNEPQIVWSEPQF
jgi:hypothetical protein